LGHSYRNVIHTDDAFQLQASQ